MYDNDMYVDMFFSSLFTAATKKIFWQLWDSNPRPFGQVPKTSTLDHSAKLPYDTEAMI